MKLYEVKAAVMAVQEMLANDEIDEQTAADTIESLFPVVQDKGINLCALIQNTESSIREIREAEKRMAERRKKAERGLAWFRSYLSSTMEVAGIKELSCPEFTARLRANPPSVNIEDGAEIPEEFLVKTESVRPDKKALKAFIETGGELDGVSVERSVRIVFE